VTSRVPVVAPDGERYAVHIYRGSNHLGIIGVVEYMIRWAGRGGGWVVEVEREIQRSEYRQALPFAWRWQSRALRRNEAEAEVARVVDLIRGGGWPDTSGLYLQG